MSTKYIVRANKYLGNKGFLLNHISIFIWNYKFYNGLLKHTARAQESTTPNPFLLWNLVSFFGETTWTSSRFHPFGCWCLSLICVHLLLIGVSIADNMYFIPRIFLSHWDIRKTIAWLRPVSSCCCLRLWIHKRRAMRKANTMTPRIPNATTDERPKCKKASREMTS